MKHTLRLTVVLLLLLAATRQSDAQSRLGIFAGGGIAWYYGDMNDRVITHEDLITFQFNGGLLYRLSQRWNIVGNFHYGSLEGADSLAVSEFKLKRDLHFRSELMEGSLLLNYYLLNSRVARPYLLGGVGYFHFNPVADSRNGEVELQPLGTEGQFIQGGNNPAPYDLYQVSFPLGIGVEFMLSRAFALRLEVVNHLTRTDYLDDVSTRYPDSTLLAVTPNGPVAVEMSSNVATGFPEPLKARGDSRQRDMFTTASITLLYTPVIGKGSGSGFGNRTGSGMKAKKKRKASCAAYD
jgi:hypothetical protein